MRGNQIVISQDPRGRFIGGVVSGTPLPGTIMQIVAGTAVDGNGDHTWAAFNRDADGDRPLGPLAVLLAKGEGFDTSVAYEDGHQANLYIPLPGDELNVRWATSGTGTGDALTVGQIGIVEDGTGLVIDTTGSPQTEPFTAMEAVDDTVAAGTLVWVSYSGF